MISLAGIDGAVGVLDAHQAFIKRRLPAMRIDHRFVSQQDAPVVQRGHDLVGRADVFLAQRVALDIRLIGEERARPLGLGAIERFLRARQNFVDIARMAGRGDAADRRGDRDRPDRRHHHIVAHPASKRSAATGISSGEQLRRIKPNLFPEKRPRQSSVRILVRRRLATALMTSSAMS